MADNSVDAIVTDPPYGIGYASSRTTRDKSGAPRINKSTFGKDVYCDTWLCEAFRVLKQDACMYLFTRWDVLSKWKASIEAAGFTVTQRLVWDKKHWKMGDLRYYGSQVEDVLFCRKGTPTMRYEKRRGNLFSQSASWLPEGQYDHPTQKPEGLLAQYILDSTSEGDTVLDPFMGSGSTGAAAIRLGRGFVGIEIDSDFYAIAQRRIQEAQQAAKQLTMEGVA
jgi:DNA modification methylase